jgi:exonuclease VII small subunit
MGDLSISVAIEDRDPDQEAIARALAELDRLTLEAERAIAASKQAEDTLQKIKQKIKQLEGRSPKKGRRV